MRLRVLIQHPPAQHLSFHQTLLAGWLDWDWTKSNGLLEDKNNKMALRGPLSGLLRTQLRQARQQSRAQSVAVLGAPFSKGQVRNE